MKNEHVYKDFVALTWYNLVLQRITLDWWSAPIKTLYYDLISWKQIQFVVHNVAEKRFLLKTKALWALLGLFIRPLAVLLSRGIESIGCSTCISFKKVFVFVFFFSFLGYFFRTWSPLLLGISSTSINFNIFILLS